jgi:hypothetical protein
MVESEKVERVPDPSSHGAGGVLDEKRPYLVDDSPLDALVER